MDETVQGKQEGFSPSEKAQLVRAAVVGALASGVTLWMGGVFTAGALPRHGTIEIVVAGLCSFIAAAVVSVMGETVMEDLVKLAMFGFLWWFARSYELFDLITLGALAGGGIAFVSNRFREEPRRQERQRKKLQKNG